MKFFREHSGKSETFSRYIVNRSASVPAQMCAYKIGMMKMLELRGKMEQKFGAQFDVRDFHHAVLRHGSLPLALLESLVSREMQL